MNYYVARQRKSDNKWEYTCSNDEMIWPVGYCGGEKFRQFYRGHYHDKFHGDGHATLEEAIACYHCYLLDNHLTFSQLTTVKRKCDAPGCGEWTQGAAQINGYTRLILCDKHANRENVESLYRPSSESWGS